ncbi:hypothetical protein ACFL5M_04850 [Candidatus Neomarinimicrobiota bacterium]
MIDDAARGSLTGSGRTPILTLNMFGKRKKKSATRAPQKPTQPSRTPVKPSVPRSIQEAKGAVEVTSDAFLSKLSPEARAQLEANEKIMADVRKFVEEHPEEASQLLRVWLKVANEGD